jgi:hypothetical protein
MFFKTKSQEHKSFLEMMKKVSDENQVKIYIWLCLYGFIKVTIKDKLIKPLNKIINLSEGMEDLVYYFVFGKMDLTNFEKYHLNIGNGDLLFRGMMGQASLEQTNNTTKVKKEMDIIIPDIDDNELISFNQMMVKIYALMGKEYSNEEFDKYKQIFDDYKYIINNIFEGAYIGIKRSNLETIVKRANDNLYVYSDFEIFSFKTALMMTMLNSKK